MMKFGLSEQLAQSIVKRTIDVIPYNVNVMNNEGVIIASRDEERIGMLHQGALKAIHMQGLFEVREETMTDKIGVNIPIKYKNEIVGVIGISGNPDKVRSLVHVLKVIAELMIEQQYIINNDLRARVDFENFLREWCESSKEHYTEEFRRQAENWGINLDAQRIAAVFEVDRPKNSLLESVGTYLHDGEYLFRYKENILILFQDIADISSKLMRIYNRFEEINAIGVGIRTSDVANSVNKAQRSLSIAKKIYGQAKGEKRIAHFNECMIYDMVSNYPEHEAFRQIIANLNRKFGSNELTCTLEMFFKFNGDVKQIIEHLHIHRNTLSYRLKKIEELSGKSLKNFDDLFYFYVAYLVDGLKR